MEHAKWIWYPGDFEIYHALQQNLSREERGFRWPAYWHLDDCRKNIRFHQEYELDQSAEFVVFSNALGYVDVNGTKYRYGERITCEPGTTKITVYAGILSGVPSVFVEGEVIYSDVSWEVDDFVSEPVRADCNSRYTRADQDPSQWEYDYKEVAPKSAIDLEEGCLLEFEHEITASLEIELAEEVKSLLVCYGESVTEAMDTKMCYFSQKITVADKPQIPVRAFRFLFLPHVTTSQVTITAKEQSVKFPEIGRFVCDSEKMNQIWEVAEQTFRLCSGIFFIDGIKRDKWIWSGDAYQSYFINQYLYSDPDINKRTIWALRGNDPIRQHINTIVDYSMYWVISIYHHFNMTGDLEFIQRIYPKMQSMMQYLLDQTDDNGFIVGRQNDWIFIDWAEIDKEGPVCAEQMLLLMCYKTMMECGKYLQTENCLEYSELYVQLQQKIETYYWDEEQGAYIDSFQSGKSHVSRHANIFAIIFDLVSEDRAGKILEEVLQNAQIPEITTPYFKFYELEAFCKMKKFEHVKELIIDYWGGMLDSGADTFWEEYDKNKPLSEQYEMYGDPYGKSMCHAWGASPIYLIGRYFMGVRPTSAGYQAFQVEPQLDLFSHFECQVPLNDGVISIKWNENQLQLWTNKTGGELYLNGEVYQIPAFEKWTKILR